MDIYDLVITNLGMWLTIANQTLGHFMTVPANATGPLDSSIMLTSAGESVVGEIASAAIQISQALVELLLVLFG